MPATVMRHPSWCPPQPPHLDCPCGCGGKGECHREPCVPDCGDRPPWGWWGWKMRQSWQDVRFLEKTIKEVVADMVKDGTLGVDIPIQGVQDGSDAAPGMVGEWIQWQAEAPVVQDTATTTLISMGVLPPGDWDCIASLQDFSFTTGNLFWLNPVPSGFSTNMFGVQIAYYGGEGLPGSPNITALQANTVVGIPARASLTAPTLVPFTVTTNYENGTVQTPVIPATLMFQARRRR